MRSAPPFENISTIVLATSGAIVLATSVCQLDCVSRWLLSANRLYTKRRRQQQYLLAKLLQKCTDQFWPSEFRESTRLILEEDHQDLQKLLDDSRANTTLLEIATIVQGQIDTNDYYNHYLLLSTNKASSNVFLQVPLLPFARLLAKQFESEATSTAFCFIADASSGLGTRILNQLLTVAKRDTGVVVVNQPLWIYTLVMYLQQLQQQQEKDLLMLIFALFRLEERRLKSHIGPCKTIAFILPTQSSTAPLLRLLQKAFPCERHVFVYDGAAASTFRALRQQQNNKSIDDDDWKVKAISQLTSLPIQNLYNKMNNITFYSELAKLPSDVASSIESWMSSVDAFLQLKEDLGPTEYLPFVLQCKFLFQKDSIVQKESNETNSTVREMCLGNVLHYILGVNKSRPLSASLLQEAFDLLKSFDEEYHASLSSLPNHHRKLVEATVFCHKKILIGDKTLIDTVVPQIKWTLKAAKKITGCACCAPEEEDDDDDNERNNEAIQITDQTKASINTNASGSSTTETFGNPNYVDGRAKFAFDPSIFSKPRAP